MDLLIGFIIVIAVAAVFVFIRMKNKQEQRRGRYLRNKNLVQARDTDEKE